MLLMTLAALVALGQAPPLTRAEQLQDAARKGDAATVRTLIDGEATSIPSSATTRPRCSTRAITVTWRS